MLAMRIIFFLFDVAFLTHFTSLLFAHNLIPLSFYFASMNEKKYPPPNGYVGERVHNNE